MTDKPVQKLANQIPSKLSTEEWSQAHETIVMLNLAIAQIEFSMTDGDDSIDVLTESFTSMSEGVYNIAESIKSFAKISDIDPGLRNQLMQECNDLGGKMQKAIVAFQFYDKLVQRLSHVRNSMTHLTDVIGDEGKLHSIEAWKLLQKMVRNSYTMEEDRKLFDAIMAGRPINDVLKEMTVKQDDSSEDDIELF